MKKLRLSTNEIKNDKSKSKVSTKVQGNHVIKYILSFYSGLVAVRRTYLTCLACVARLIDYFFKSILINLFLRRQHMLLADDKD